VQTGNGTYQTYAVQVGTASGVSSSSITLKSADGYSHAYVVTASTVVDAQRDGIASVKNGDQVRLIATVSGGTSTATDIVDITKVGAGRPGRPGFFPGPPGPIAGLKGRMGPAAAA
jgi:hypothetical protein